MAYCVSLRYYTNSVSCLFYFVYLCCFMQKKQFPSSFYLWISVKKYLHKDISLYCPLPTQNLLLISASKSREICRVDSWGETTACFYEAVSPSSCEEAILLWTRSEHKGPTEMLLAFLVLIHFPRDSVLQLGALDLTVLRKNHIFIYPYQKCHPMHQ